MRSSSRERVHKISDNKLSPDSKQIISVTTPRRSVPLSLRLEHCLQANMPSFTRIGTITRESCTLDTMIPANVGKYDSRGSSTRSKRHPEHLHTETSRPNQKVVVPYRL